MSDSDSVGVRGLKQYRSVTMRSSTEGNPHVAMQSLDFRDDITLLLSSMSEWISANYVLLELSSAFYFLSPLSVFVSLALSS